jgi:hypothetical protein
VGGRELGSAEPALVAVIHSRNMPVKAEICGTVWVRTILGRAGTGRRRAACRRPPGSLQQGRQIGRKLKLT